MNIVFFGSSKYSVIVAEKLNKRFGLSLIVTKLNSSNVRIFADKYSIPIVTIDKLTYEIIEKITKVKPDFLIIADYGLILPKILLSIPKFASLNVHHSLLPKYRGPSPAPSAILNGEKISGVSIITMTEKVDAGDILAQKKYNLASNETTDSLLTRLNMLGGEIILKVIANYKYYFANRHKQHEKEATFTKYIKKLEGYINKDNPPPYKLLDRMIRAYYPWPGVWTKMQFNNKELRIKFLPEKTIQVEGKKIVSLRDFINGYPNAREFIRRLFGKSV